MTTVDVVIASPVVVDVVAGIPMPAGAHAGTHETGGSDPITDLDAAVITSGVLDAARLPAIPPAAPLAHHVSHELGGADVVTLAQSQVTGLSGALAGKVDTTDPRLSDARTPTAHHGTHDTGGSDPIAALDAAVIATGTINAARLPATAPSAHHVSHETGGADALAALSAGILTSGTLPNARLAPDVTITSSVAIGTNPASAGAIRLANNSVINARNAANSADIRIATVDVNNDLNIGASGPPGKVIIQSGTQVVSYVGALSVSFTGSYWLPSNDATMRLGASSNRWSQIYGVDGVLSTSVQIGTNPASTGAIRLANGASIQVRNSGNTADLPLLVGTTFVNRTKAGTPVDADVTTPTDGMLIVDTTANKIWVRIGGVWKGATVA